MNLAVVILPGGPEVEAWDVWLRGRGRPPLSVLNDFAKDRDGHVGWRVPERRPPLYDDRLGTLIADRWAAAAYYVAS